MKYIKSINEYLNSEKYTYVKWISKSILKDLKKINIMPYYINSTGFSLSFDVDFDIDKPLLVKNKIFNVLNKWKRYSLEKR